MPRPFTIGGLIAVAFLRIQVHAQPWTNATCTSQLWSFNSRQQSPCLVSAHLSAQCTDDNTWGVSAITNGGSYSPPTKERATPCRCNSVTWGLLSACSMCQGGDTGSWGRWITNCTNPVVAKYPLPIPSAVSVPHWAYYDFTISGVFNAIVASQQSGPESSAVPSSPATSISEALSTVYATRTAPPSGSGSSGGDTIRGTNTGAIVGGVVGGILGLALIAAIAFVLLRKSKQNRPDTPTIHYVHGPYAPTVDSQPNSVGPMTEQYQPGAQRPTMVSPMGSGYIYKPYDPSDPSTFLSGLNNNTAPHSFTKSLPYTYQPQTRPGQYRGTPEV